MGPVVSEVIGECRGALTVYVVQSNLAKVGQTVAQHRRVCGADRTAANDQGGGRPLRRQQIDGEQTDRCGS